MMQKRKIQSRYKSKTPVTQVFAEPREKELLEVLNKRKNNEDFFLKVENFLQGEFVLNKDLEILAAVSGGVDSAVMLDVLVCLAKQHGFKVSAAHYNHSLREKESDEDERFTASIAGRHELSYFSQKGNVRQYAESHACSVEEAARAMRYRFLEKTAKNKNIKVVATAHNADDNAETFLLNLFRGTGLTGLSGIPHLRPLSKKTVVIRPLIGIKKSEIIDYALRNNLKWREDRSNLSLIYKRNKIRRELIPHLEKEFTPAIVDILNRTSNFIHGADLYIKEHIEKIYPSLIAGNQNGSFEIKAGLMEAYDKFIQGELIQHAVERNFEISALPLQTVERIIKLLQSPVNSKCEINKNIEVIRGRRTLIFYKVSKEQTIDEKIEKTGNYKFGKMRIEMRHVRRSSVKFTPDPNIEYFDSDLLPEVLTLRHKRPGDTFTPFGMTGSMKIGDFLTNEKVPVTERKHILVLAAKSEIIWVCGFRASDRFKVTDTTKKFLKAKFVRKK